MNSTDNKEENPFDCNSKVTNEQILEYIWTVICKYRQQKEQNRMECILCEQKLVHLTLLILQKQPQAKLSFDIKEQIVGLVQKINQLAMQSIKENMESINPKLILKAVDIIMLPEVPQHIIDNTTLTKLKILTFNNLACVLKNNKHYMMALKAVTYAVDLEEQMIKNINEEEQYDIVATYLNKAAILSDMNKHSRALEEIRKARNIAEKIEKDVEMQLRNCQDQSLAKRLEEKKHYGMYMKMLINYSVGVEKEHQKLISSAVSYYQEGKRLALLIDNQLMVHKLEAIILKLKKQ